MVALALLATLGALGAAPPPPSVGVFPADGHERVVDAVARLERAGKIKRVPNAEVLQKLDDARQLGVECTTDDDVCLGKLALLTQVDLLLFVDDEARRAGAVTVVRIVDGKSGSLRGKIESVSDLDLDESWLLSGACDKGVLRLSSTPAGLKVSVDGAPLPSPLPLALAVAPGAHAVALVDKPDKPASVDVEPCRVRDKTLDLARLSEAPPTPAAMSAVSWLPFGVAAGALVGAGAMFGGAIALHELVLNDKDSLGKDKSTALGLGSALLFGGAAASVLSVSAAVWGVVVLASPAPVDAPVDAAPAADAVPPAAPGAPGASGAP